MPWPRVLAAALLLAMLGAPRVGGQEAGAFAGPEAFEWRLVFKLINVTSHAEPGDVGFVREGDDTRDANEQSLRLQFTGQPVFWLDYRLDYLTVKQNLPLGGTQPAAATGGAALFRRWDWRRFIEQPRTAPGQRPSTQTVRWWHEVDHAFVRIAAGPVEAVLGRQPITWGVGRVWQPTDLFTPFGPQELDTEFKAGVDGALLSAFPFDFATVQLAYLLGPDDPQQGLAGEDRTAPDDSAVLRWRGLLGAVTELTLLAGTVREEPVAGGTVETTWLEAGWRLETLAFEPRDQERRERFTIAGVDFRFGGGVLALLELYDHTLGATREGELAAVTRTRTFLEGRLLQLSRRVLAVGVATDVAGVWNLAYTLFGAALRDEAGQRHGSTLHRFTVTYGISDNAEAVFSASGGNGRGLAANGTPRSEFGHVPRSLYVSLQFTL